MFSSPILDVAVTLIFVYFIFALAVSAFNEFLHGLMRTRAKMLEDSIKNFLPNEANWGKIYGRIMDSPPIQILKQKDVKFPSYIPPDSFSQALISVIAPDKDEPGTASTFKAAINNSLFGNETKTMMNSFIDKTADSLDQFKKNIENQFNASMAELSAAYKRKIQIYIFFIALAITAAFNLDTINIAQKLWANPSLAKASADKISMIIEKDSVKNTLDKLTEAAKDSTVDIKKLKENINILKDINSKIAEVPLPIGWTNKDLSTNILYWLAKLLGLLITTFAITLGAPFWFDVLNKVSNLRTSGKRISTDNSDNK